MATVVTARPTTEETAIVAPKPIHGAPSSSATVVMHVVPAREQVRMGKKATIPDGVNWTTLVAMSLFHAGALAAFFFFSWQRLAVAAILYILAINVGIGMCYHRLLTHRGYHVPKWLEYIMTVCATLSLEGGPIFWVSTHRVHHQLSDHEGDPHTPNEGGWFGRTVRVLFFSVLLLRPRLWRATRPTFARTSSTCG
jgi:stearoyl-CoA desaturase (delta-9 desaturase)